MRAAPHSHPPAPASGGGGMLSGLGGMVAQGMALGTGSALAHKVHSPTLRPAYLRPTIAEGTHTSCRRIHPCCSLCIA